MPIQDSIAFEQQLYELINTSNLSLDTAFYIFKTVYLDLEKTFIDCVNSEKKQSIKVNENNEQKEEHIDANTADWDDA